MEEFAELHLEAFALIQPRPFQVAQDHGVVRYGGEAGSQHVLEDALDQPGRKRG